jgi:hypothetical protein
MTLPNWFDMIDGTADIFPSRFDFEVTKEEALLLEQIQAACEAKKNVRFDYMTALVAIKTINQKGFTYKEDCEIHSTDMNGKCFICGKETKKGE